MNREELIEKLRKARSLIYEVDSVIPDSMLDYSVDYIDITIDNINDGEYE